MSEPAIEVGDKVHIITRRLFDGDMRRNFVGEVTRVSGELHEVVGYAFVFQTGVNAYKKRPDRRTRLFRLGDAGLIVVKMPREVAVEAIEYRLVEKRLVVTEGERVVLDIDEFGSSR
jgi:hypothetical protein